MPNLDINCDNCGSHFTLDFIDDEVSYSPTHCPFCGDVYETESEELDFNDDTDELYDGDDE
jgi:uncharacterized Zn finger protein